MAVDGTSGLFDLVLGPVGDTGAEIEAGTFLVGVLLVGMCCAETVRLIWLNCAMVENIRY